MYHLSKIAISFFSGTSEVRFPINIGITGFVATTGEVFFITVCFVKYLRKQGKNHYRCSSFGLGMSVYFLQD